MLFRNVRSQATEAESLAVRRRVEKVRQQIGTRDVRVVDLFAELGEDEWVLSSSRTGRNEADRVTSNESDVSQR